MTFFDGKISDVLPIVDPVLIFGLVMAIILVVPLISQKLRTPSIVGLIVSGALAGPGGLGLLERDNTMILLGTVGLLYLMFIAGISLDLEKFSKYRAKSLSFGIISFGIPMGGSILLAPTLLDYSLESALLLGAITGSHTLLAYPIANRLGIARNTAVTMSLGATMVTDALSLTVLAFVAAWITGDVGAGFWFTFLGMATIYLGVILLILPRLGRWFFRSVRDQTNIEYVFLLTVLFVTAYLAQMAGLAAIIGAFLAGFTMNKLVPENSSLMNRLQFVGNALFIPFFLISVGMLVEMQVLLAIEVWAMAALFFGLVIVGKLIASKSAEKIFRLTSDEGWVMLGLTSPQAAATLAVTLIGFEIGLFDELAVNAVVLLMLGSCFAGPWLVDTYGRRIVLRQEKEGLKASDTPERILVPLSNPETSESLMDIALMIRGKNSTEPVFPLTVARESRYVEAAVASGERLLSHAVVHAAAADVPVMPVTRVDMNIASGIIRATRELRISDIVIGWNGEITTEQRIFGTILDQLLEQSDETILVSKIEQPLNTCERALLAIPPMAQYEPGFGNSFQTIKKLIHQLGAKPLVFTGTSNLSIIKPFMEAQEPELAAEYKIVRNWNTILPMLKELYSKQDLIILFSARSGSIAWQPALERLPRQIVKKIEPENLMIVYPAISADTGQTTAVLRFEDSPLLPDISAQGIYIAKERESSHSNAIEHLVQAHFPDRADVSTEVMQQIKAMDPEEHASDLPGILMYHLSTHFVQQPSVMLAVNEKGFKVRTRGEKVKIMCILLSPTHMSLQRNLLILNKLGRMIGKKEIRDALAASKNIDEMRDVLSAKITILPADDQTGEGVSQPDAGDP